MRDGAAVAPKRGEKGGGRERGDPGDACVERTFEPWGSAPARVGQQRARRGDRQGEPRAEQERRGKDGRVLDRHLHLLGQVDRPKLRDRREDQQNGRETQIVGELRWAEQDERGEGHEHHGCDVQPQGQSDLTHGYFRVYEIVVVAPDTPATDTNATLLSCTIVRVSNSALAPTNVSTVTLTGPFLRSGRS